MDTVINDASFEPTGLGATIELAWAAGFFDGEGCITLSRGLPTLSIAQVDREVLDRFKRAVGPGSVNGPYDYASKERREHFLNRKPQYRYQLSRLDDVRNVIDLLSPYLSSIKKEKAYELLSQVAEKESRPLNFRLTPDDVRSIRSYWRMGLTIPAIAEKYNKDRSTIRRIVIGETWIGV